MTNLSLSQKYSAQPKAARIKVLFVIDKLVPAGTQKNLLEIVSRLDRARFTPEVVSFHLGSEADWFRQKSGLEPRLIPVKRAYDWSGVRALSALRGLIRREKFDLVQLHFLQAEMLAVPASFLSGEKPVVITTRRDEGFWRSPRQLAMSRFFAHRVDYVLANSKAVQKAVLEKEGVSESRTAVIYNGVDTSLFFADEGARQRVRAEFKIEKSDCLVVTISNMRHEVKGYGDLIEAAALVHKKNPAVKFLFAGDGELRSRYEDRVSELGLSNAVIFAGVRQDIPALLNGADTVCQPSHSEGFSNTVLEAMASQKAVIATAVGGNPEVIEDNVCGLLIPPRAPEALADAVLALAEDRGRAERLALAARAKIEKAFSMRAMIQAYESFYQQAVDFRRSKK